MGIPAAASAPQHVATLSDGREVVRMLCEVELPTDGEQAGKAPAWVQVLPVGPLVKARDGRSFQISDALKVAASVHLPLVVDWDHESEFGKTRAAAWVEELRVQLDDEGEFPRPGIWGRVNWTADGRADIESRAYRFLSPSVLLSSEERDLQDVLAVALTNRPALLMHGLDSFRERLSQQYGPLADDPGGCAAMKPEHRKALTAALGLQPDADDSALVQTVSSFAASAGELTTLRQANATLTTQLSAANANVVKLEQQVAEQSKAQFSARVDAVLETAGKEGRVLPAQAGEYRAFCLESEKNFEFFQKQILPNLSKQGQDAPPSPKGNGGKLDPKLAKYGISAEEAAAAEQYNAERRDAAEAEE